MSETAARNPLRESWATGRHSVGTWCEIPDPFVAEILGAAGFEWVCADWQHGLHDYDSLLAVVHAISCGGAVPLVRVPLNAEWVIQKALDAGAFGVIVPLVSSAEDAARAAAACRYPPDGVRSYGPIRAARAISVDPATVNREVLCIPMIETAAGVENIDAIASTGGVDALIVGPYDMSLSMELPLGSPDVAPAIERVLAAGDQADIPVGRHLDAAEDAAEGFAQGFAFISIGTDREFLAATAVDQASRARHDAAAPPNLDRTIARPVATSAGE